jgi:hypothetical protein
MGATMESFRSDQAVILRRNRVVLAFPAMAVLAGLVVLVLEWAHAIGGPGFGQLLTLGGLLGFLGVWRWNPARQETRVSLEADARGVHADHVPLLSRDAIREGYVQPNPDGPPTVKLRTRRRGRGFEIRVENAEEAHALLRALHLGEEHARATFWAPSPLLVSLPTQILSAIAWMVLTSAAMTMVGPSAAGAMMLVYMVLYVLPKRVVAGVDGVRIGWLGPGKFIPYSMIRHASLEDAGVVITLRSGARVRLPFKRPLRGIELLLTLFHGQNTAIVERIEQGLQAHARSVADRDAGGLLARGGRTARDWLRALHTLGAGDAADYRAATMPADLLWRIAENAAAPPHERAAAAVALEETLDDQGRARLRALAEATAAPKVRVALEAVAAKTDEEKLARALEECEEEEAARRLESAQR